MRSFSFRIAQDVGEAARLAAQEAGTQFLAGGTTLVDLMKLDVLQPRTVVDINAAAKDHGQINVDTSGLRLGALVRMSAAAEHPAILHDYPMIAQSLHQAASPQLRNMASLGGNVLQRTRCAYFRDPSWMACNKRSPGSGCAALTGINRRHAVLGTSSQCIATYPGDFANALVALGAEVSIQGVKASRTISFEALHRLPDATPHIETVLATDEVITGFNVPAGPWTRRSVYLKIRDRESYDFAQASAAVALHIQDGVVREARIAVGGVATKPWRAMNAETALQGKAVTAETATAAATLIFLDAVTHGENAFKPELGRRTVVRALLQAAAMEA